MIGSSRSPVYRFFWRLAQLLAGVREATVCALQSRFVAFLVALTHCQQAGGQPGDGQVAWRLGALLQNVAEGGF